MPLEVPPCRQSFIDAVTVCVWVDGHLETRDRVKRYPQTGRAWSLQASGLLISITTHRLLCDATANTDGSFTKSGVAYWLTEVGGWAVEVTV